jgi:hypothetical protein
MRALGCRLWGLGLALCAQACALPGAPEPVEHEVEIDVGVDAPADGAIADEACAAFCSELATSCPGTLATAESCNDACEDAPTGWVTCREEWLASGSCIAASLDSPTCGDERPV